MNREKDGRQMAAEPEFCVFRSLGRPGVGP